MTALRTNQVDLIDNMAYTDAATFPQRYAGKFQTWDIQALGTSFITFNLKKGPFAYSSPDSKMLRQAAAYATDLEAIHQAVFYERGEIATGYFPSVSPGIKSIVYLTCEFIEPRSARTQFNYLCFPILDGCAPDF